MKKIILSTFMLLLTLSLLFSAVGCQKTRNESEPETSAPTETKLATEGITSPTEDAKESTQPETQDTEPVDNKNQIVGKYVCVSNYCMEIDNPDYVPYIIFNTDGSCEMFVNYMGGVTLFSGTYRIDDNKIFVDLDLESEGSGFEGTIPNSDEPYMDDKYVFEITDYDHITIGPAEGAYYNGDCYAVRGGDPFERQ